MTYRVENYTLKKRAIANELCRKVVLQTSVSKRKQIPKTFLESVTVVKTHFQTQ